jgi:predicted RNA-binding protein with PIN domain
VSEGAEQPADPTVEPGLSGPLPEAVRQRVVGLAAETLAALPEDEVPAPLRAFRSWAPAHRAKRAATPLAAALERDVLFRQRTYARAAAAATGLADALRAGAAPSAADPVDVASLAYLGRHHDWVAQVETAAAALAEAAAVAAGDRAEQERVRLEAELAAARTAAEAEQAVLRRELAAVRAELAGVTKELRTEKGARRRAERSAAAAGEAAAQASDEAARSSAAAAEDVRRANARQAAAEAALAAARRAAREGRSLEDVRLRLLLDTVVEAASGLRRELALPPPDDRPADHVDAARPGDEVSDEPGRALGSDDPALLDQLLALPQVHLIVDGYNVTKTGFPDLPLERQRTRLVNGLAALAARCGAEVTCCFDGATVAGRVPALSARGVRVLFSKPDEIADELIRRLVRAEPAGRPVVVVSSDREVADGIRRAGARPVEAAALVRRLDRG